MVRMNIRTQQGFTIYELMMTVLIVGVVLSIGIPNLSAFRQNSRMTTTANDLHSSFHLARSEAARAKNNITICSSTDPMAEAPALPTCSGEFENGWVVFEDRDGDIVIDAAEPILRRFPPTAAGVTINTAATPDYFSFAANGQGRGDVLAGVTAVSTAVLCDDRGNIPAGGGHSAARVLVVTPLGRATVLRDEGQVTFHGGC